MKLSPYLLATEKVVESMKSFKIKFREHKKLIVGRAIGFSLETGIIRERVEDPKDISEIDEIVDYSIPSVSAGRDRAGPDAAARDHAG
jgi:hypothetical protein